MHISDAEWIVMNLFWEYPALESAEVIEHTAAANSWSPKTVKTMLHRLVRKRALSAEAHGNRYVYRAAIRRHDCLRRASRAFMERVCGGHAAPALIHLLRSAKLTPQEAVEIRALLDQRLAETEGTDL
jgi:BlaI family penicillinase repressor